MPTALDHVDALQKQIIALQPISKERQQIIDKKFRLEFNYNSNHMEGNTLTYGETELLLIFEDTKGNHNMREYEEMRNHDVAFKMIDEWAKDKERGLTEQNIKNLNEIILVRPFWKEAMTPDGDKTRRLIKVGSYKEFPNSVRLQNGEMFNYTSPTDTPIEMAELMDWYRSEENALHPITLATMLHYKFVRIHPFDDGNGRVARLLMNYVFLRNGFPPVIIKSEDKVNYLRVLHLADVGDYEPLINYVAEQMIWSQQIVVRGAKGDSIDEPGDYRKRLKSIKNRLNTKEDSEVRVLRNINAIVDCWESSLLPLTKAVEKSIAELSVIFKSTTQEIFLIYGTQTIRSRAGIEAIRKVIVQNGGEPSSLHLGYNLAELRDAEKLNLSVNLDFVFHTNVYEVRSNGIHFPVNKLYDETLSQEEIQLISESVGNYLASNVEKYLDDTGHKRS